MPDAVRYFRARHVATMMPQGVIEDGCVIVKGNRIEDVGPTRQINPPHIDEDIDGLLTPGLINAHTHLELTTVPRPETPGTFQDWLLTTMASMREPDVQTFNRKRAEAVREGIAQCLKFGVTCVGDISQNVGIVRPLLRDGPIRSTSFGECLGLGKRRARFNELYEHALDWSLQSGHMDIGIAPHAPYTVDDIDYRRVAYHRVPEVLATTHLLETADEDEFLRWRTGQFADLYQRLGNDPGPATYDIAPFGVFGLCFDLSSFLYAHVNYCDDACLEEIYRKGSRVVWCPRTHAYFGHPPHRWRDMRAIGIPVCVGTDSCASSPDLNVLDDVRLVRLQCPDESADALWNLVTASAADSMHWPRWTDVARGRIQSTLDADFCAWPTQTNDPLAEVLDTPGMLPSGVWIGGGKVAPSAV